MQLKSGAVYVSKLLLLELIELSNKMEYALAFVENQQPLAAIAMVKRAPGALQTLRQQVKEEILSQPAPRQVDAVAAAHPTAM